MSANRRPTEADIPQPSRLPANPSVGELMAEIDDARHAAARAMTAVATKLDVLTPLQRRSRRQVAAIRQIGTKVIDVTPDPVRAAATSVARSSKKVPVLVWLFAALVLLRWWHRRH